MIYKHSNPSFFNLPSLEILPELNQSLQLINTINMLPNNPSFESMQFQHSQHLEQQDSLAERISHVNTTTQSAKKRKTGCTCKKTLCLKMYCECFSQGKQCGEDCGCLNCQNVPGFEQTIKTAKMSVKEGGTRNCLISQKRCNCKKSHCMKRYCECYNAGVGCSAGCRCQSCQNKTQHQNSHENIQNEKHLEKEHPQQPGQQKQIFLPVEFLSTNAYRSIDELSKFYS